MKPTTAGPVVSRRRPRPAAAEPLERRALMAGVAFGSPTEYGTGSSLGAAVVDLNGDGHPDVVSPDSAAGSSDGVTVHLNDGDGTLGDGTSYTTSTANHDGLQPYAVASGDFNGDGHPDVAVANFASGTVSILFGDGAGGLDPPAVYVAGSEPDSVVVADFNGDGHPDVAVGNRGDDTVDVYLNQGNGSFVQGVVYTADGAVNNIAVGDLNGDGHPDLVTADGSADTADVFLGSASGAFAAPVAVAVPNGAGYVAVADMNADGHADLVVAENTAAVGVVLGNGTGTTFAAPVDEAVSAAFTQVAVADLNADGIPDVAGATGAGTTVSVLTGVGDGTLAAEATFDTGLPSYSVTTGDLDGDGKPDLVVGSYEPGGGQPAFATLLDAAASATVPTPPAGTTYLTGFAKNNNVYTNLDQQFPHSGTGTPGSGAGAADAAFLFDPAPAAVAAAGYAPDYVAGSNLANNGVDFALTSDAAGHDFDQIDGGQTDTVTAGASGVQTVYALLGAYDGQSVNVTFTGADGTTQTFDGVGLPDFNGGGPVNTTGVNPTIQTVFQVADVGAGGSGNSATGATTTYGLTEVAFTLEASLTAQPLASVTFASNGYDTLLLAATAVGATPTTTPSPTPTATATKTIGGLDPSFGTGGLASHDVGLASVAGVIAYGAQSVLIGPVGTAPDESFGVTRYNADGSLDTSFGTNGVAVSSFGTGVDAVPSSLVQLVNGDVLVAGTATTYAADGITVVGSEFALAEYLPDGTVNPAFGNGSGLVLVSFDATPGALTHDVLRAIAVSQQGVIFLGGSTDAAGAGNTDLAVAALSAAGTPDTDFGDGGLTTVDVAGGPDSVNALAVASNGEPVAAGLATVDGVGQVVLAKFLTSGVLDPRFGTKGLLTEAVGSVFDEAESVVIQPKGQIVIGGLTATGAGAGLSSDFLLQRFTSNGRADRSFGTGGTVVTAFAGRASAVTQVVLQTDGEIVASGRATTNLATAASTDLEIALARFTTRGALDTSFNGTGKAVLDLTTGAVSNGSAAILHAAAASAAADLGAEFDAFTASAQGVVTVTAGGEILSAGTAAGATVEAELIAAGVDLVAKLLSTTPAAVLAGLKGTATVTVTEGGTTAAAGAVTIEVQFATTAAGYRRHHGRHDGHPHQAQAGAEPHRTRCGSPTRSGWPRAATT